MATFTIELDEAMAEEVRRRAAEEGIAPEEILVRRVSNSGQRTRELFERLDKIAPGGHLRDGLDLSSNASLLKAADGFLDPVPDAA